MHLVVVGLSHKTAPVAIREKLAFPADALEDALLRLTHCAEVREAVLVSTCNRTEVYAVAAVRGGVDAIVRFLASTGETDARTLEPYLYTLTGEAAVRHLFRVTASLDSMVVGEAQILGQVKDAYERSLASGCTSRALNRLFRQSLEAGKRVRSETAIGEAAVSISYAAVELARKVFDTLTGRTVLLIGAGQMSELTAKHLVSNGAERVLVANRTLCRAEELAAGCGGTAVPYEELSARLHEADIVISSTAATGYVLTRSDVAAVMRARTAPLFLIDIAVPRDIDPAANSLPNVFLYDIDALTGVVESNLEERAAEGRRAEGIVEEETRDFLAWIESLEVVPTVAAIRAKAEVIRRSEVEKTFRKLDLSEKERAAVEAMSCAIVNKMLHGPTARLKRASAAVDGYVYLDAARALYGLDDTTEVVGHGFFRNIMNRRARDVLEKQKQTGEPHGGC